MIKNVIDEVRLLAPTVDPTNESDRARQRQKLADAIAVESVLVASPGPLSGMGDVATIHHSRPSRRRFYVVGAVAAVAAAVVAIPLSLTGPTPVASAVVITAGPTTVRVGLPQNFQLASVSLPSCASAPVDVAWVSPATASSSTSDAASPTDSVSETFKISAPSYAAQIDTAANAQGGCAAMALAQPYTPTAANPDPEAGRFENTPPVAVGPYQGREGTWTSYSKPSDVATQNASLNVQIPLADGQVQDLVVSGYNLSDSALVALVANGISVSGS
jgi:hypothetical protein